VCRQANLPSRRSAPANRVKLLFSNISFTNLNLACELMNYDNPAFRLLAILEAGKSFGPDKNCRKCWEEILDVRNDSALLMARLSRVIALPQRIVQDLQIYYPTQGNTWSHWEGQVSAAFMVQNMHGEWKTFFNNIDAHTFIYLKMAAELLNSKVSARLLEQEEVVQVRARIVAVLDDVLASDLRPDLKTQVCRCLRKVIEALDEYRLTGGVAVLEAAEVALGHAALDSEYRSFLNDDELGRRILDSINAAANLLTISLGLPALTVALSPLLK
jgi:hypothetical protein